MFHYLGEKVKCPVSDKNRIYKNRTKKWEYGYDESIDVVIISKDGTLGDIYEVHGLKIGLPEKPDDKNIINHGKNAFSQIWERGEIPEGLTPKTMEQTRFADYIEEEFRRRHEGVWIYINGMPIWIVGTYYFGIQWVREENDFPKFRQIQNEFMMFWEACKADPRCYGVQYIKNRRMGASLMSIFELLEAGTVVEDQLLGIVSKTGRDSSKIFRRLIKSFKRLPCFFMPVWDGTNTPKKELVLDEPTKRKGKDYEVSDGDGLGTVIGWLNTAINSLDGDAVYRSLLDESGKYPTEVPFSDYWYIVKTSHTRGIRITGKSMVVSTVNSMKKGGAEYKKIYDDSDITERDDNGETKSGLYPIFIPARFCMEGMFDRFGFSIVEDPKTPIRTDDGRMAKVGTITYLKNKAESLKNDPEKLNEFKRQFPDTIRDAFRDQSDDCEFNLTKILEQIDHNTYELNDVFNNKDDFSGNDDMERGNLSWANGERFTHVVWNPDPLNGRFFIRKGCHPPKDIRNQYERISRFGITANGPIASDLGTIGVDPYNRSKNADGRGSNGSMHLTTRMNTYGLPNNKLIMEYIDRPKKIEIFFEEVLMASIYWSVPFLSELSNERFLAFVKDNGFRHFSMNNPFKKWIDLSPTEKEFGGAPQQDAKIGDAQFYAVHSFVEDHLGVARDNVHRAIGDMGDFPFTRTLNHIKDVDTSNRTKFDAYISFSLSLLGNNKRIKKQEDKPKSIAIPFGRFDNSGVTSKILV